MEDNSGTNVDPLFINSLEKNLGQLIEVSLLKFSKIFFVSLSNQVNMQVRDSGDSIDLLSHSEYTQYENLLLLKKKSWLLGRLTLKKLLSLLNLNTETAHITFPNRQFSLSHSGNYAVAAFSNNAQINGIGIDFEKYREDKLITNRMSKFYLSQNEYQDVHAKDFISQQAILLKLWSIKEAIYKSDLDNQNKSLKNYELRDIYSNLGFASYPLTSNKRFVYRSHSLLEGVLSIAISI